MTTKQIIARIVFVLFVIGVFTWLCYGASKGDFLVALSVGIIGTILAFIVTWALINL